MQNTEQELAVTQLLGEAEDLVESARYRVLEDDEVSALGNLAEAKRQISRAMLIIGGELNGHENVL